MCWFMIPFLCCGYYCDNDDQDLKKQKTQFLIYHSTLIIALISYLAIFLRINLFMEPFDKIREFNCSDALQLKFYIK